MASSIPVKDLSAQAFWSAAGNTQPPNNTTGTQLCANIAASPSAFSTVNVGTTGAPVTDPNAILTVLNSSINYQVINQYVGQGPNGPQIVQVNFSELSSPPMGFPTGSPINTINAMASYYNDPALGGDGLYYPYQSLNGLNGGDPITPDATGTYTLTFSNLLAPPNGWPAGVNPPANPGVTISVQMGTGATR